MDLLCINDKFPNDVLAFYKQNGVSTPIEDSMYTLREVFKSSTGEIGLLLNEIRNPKIPVKHPILGIIKQEVSWNPKRFTDLLGNPLLAETLKDILQEQKGITVKQLKDLHAN